MATTFKPDNDTSDFVDGVDRHFYENQIGAASPFDETYAFRLAAARAKDKARHQMIRAVRRADQEARVNRGRLEEIGDILSGSNTTVTRSIDGIEGAKDDAIKL